MAIAYVQSNVSTQGLVAGPLTCAFSSNVTAGNMLVVFVTAYDMTSSSGYLTTPTITDSLGNIYYSIPQNQGGLNIFAWFCPYATGGACTVTATLPSGTAFLTLGVMEYSGVNSYGPVDAYTYTGFSSSTAHTMGTVELLNSNELILACFMQPTGNYATTASAGYTKRIDQTNGGTPPTVAMTVTEATGISSNPSPALTYASPTTGAGLAIAFRPAAVIASPFVPVVGNSQCVHGQVDVSTSGITVTYPLATVGNFLVAVVACDGGGSAPTVTDNKGNTWVKAVQNNSGIAWTQIWSCANATGGSNHQVTVSTGGSQANICLAVMEYTVTGTVTVDQTNSGSGTSTSPNTGSVTTVKSGELYIAVLQTNYGTPTPITGPTGWSYITDLPGGTQSNALFAIAMGDMSLEAAGTYSGSWTLPSSTSWSAVIATFPGNQVAYSETLSESVSPTASLSAKMVRSVTLAESVTPSDTLAIRATRSVTLAESVTPTDFMSVGYISGTNRYNFYYPGFAAAVGSYHRVFFWGVGDLIQLHPDGDITVAQSIWTPRGELFLQRIGIGQPTAGALYLTDLTNGNSWSAINQGTLGSFGHNTYQIGYSAAGAAFTPYLVISTAGAMQWPEYTAGVLISDASGNITSGTLPPGGISNIAADTLLGNPTGSSAPPQTITLGSGLAFSGTTIIATAAGGGTVTQINPGAGITLSPSPIIGTGAVAVDQTYGFTFTGSCEFTQSLLIQGTTGNMLTVQGVGALATQIVLQAPSGHNAYIQLNNGSTKEWQVGNTASGNPFQWLNASGTLVMSLSQAGSLTLPSSSITLGTSGSTTGSIILNGSTSGSVALYAQAVAGSTNFFLPAADGSPGQFMQTNGSGVLSFATVGGSGTVTTITSGNGITLSPSTITVTGSVSVNQAYNFTFTGTCAFTNALTLGSTGQATVDTSGNFVTSGYGVFSKLFTQFGPVINVNHPAFGISSEGTDAVAAAVISNGGSGNAVNDVLTCPTVGGGDVGATFKVTSINGSAVSAIQLLTAGSYTVSVPNDVTPTSSGSGTGVKLTVITTNTLGFDMVASQALLATLGDSTNSATILIPQGRYLLGDFGSYGWTVGMVAQIKSIAVSSTGGNVTGATNATPIVITTSGAHGLFTGNKVTIASVGGNTAANGTWTITVLSTTTFSLNTSVGNGSYTASTGTWLNSILTITTWNPHGINPSSPPSVSIANLISSYTGFNAVGYTPTVINATSFYVQVTHANFSATNVTGQIEQINPYASINVIGEGNTNSIIKTNHGSAVVASLLVDQMVGTVKDFRIQMGNGANVGIKADCIAASVNGTSSSGLKILNVLVNDSAAAGIQLGGFTAVSEVLVYGCNVSNYNQLGKGIYVTDFGGDFNTIDITIEKCGLSNCKYGVMNDAGGGSVQIEECNFIQNLTNDIYLGASGAITISDNYHEFTASGADATCSVIYLNATNGPMTVTVNNAQMAPYTGYGLQLFGHSTINSGGSGYVTGDTATINGGSGTKATILIHATAGAIDGGTTLLTGGNYTAIPSGTGWSLTNITGSGTGGTVTFNSSQKPCIRARGAWSLNINGGFLPSVLNVSGILGEKSGVNFNGCAVSQKQMVSDQDADGANGIEYAFNAVPLLTTSGTFSGNILNCQGGCDNSNAVPLMNDAYVISGSGVFIAPNGVYVGTPGGPYGFIVNSSGNITELNGATTNFPSSNAAGALTNDGSGNFSYVVPTTGTVTSVQVSGGSTGLTFSGGPITVSGTITMAGTLGSGYGGTNQTTYTNAPSPYTGAFVYWDGTKFQTSAGASFYASAGTHIQLILGNLTTLNGQIDLCGGADGYTYTAVIAFPLSPSGATTFRLPDNNPTAGQVLVGESGGGSVWQNPSSLSGIGTVTSLTSGNGIVLSPTTITTTGSIAVDQTYSFAFTGNCSFTQPVGIGTTSPNGQLDVVNSAANTTLWVENYSTSTTQQSSITLAKYHTATIGGHGAVSSGEALGRWVFEGDDGSALNAAVVVKTFCDGAVSSGVVPGRVEVWTANSSGTSTKAAVIDSSQNTTLLGELILSGGHLISMGSTPGIAAGPGAGTSPTLSIVGTDVAGYIVLTVGSSPSGLNSNIAVITFAKAYASTPKTVIMTPGTQATEALNNAIQPIAGILSTTGWILSGNTFALAAGQVYQWNYLVIG